MSIWKFLGILFAILLLLGIILFVKQTTTYYQAIKRGETNPLLEQRLQSTVSKLAANQNVLPSDLAALADPKAPSQGPETAPLTIVEFLDYGCPYSRATFEPIRELAFDRPGQVRIIIRDFPIEESRPGATLAAMAARCAQEQGKFWAYHDKLFLADQRSFEENDLYAFARGISLDLPSFSECLASGRTKALVQADLLDGLRAGVEGTPTFFFNGVKVQGAPTAKTLNYIVDTFLAKTATSTP